MVIYCWWDGRWVGRRSYEDRTVSRFPGEGVRIYIVSGVDLGTTTGNIPFDGDLGIGSVRECGSSVM